MSDQSDPRVTSDHLEAALEASCDTLIALQMIRALAHGQGLLERHATQAIKSLQCAIAELRNVREAEASALAFGFVLETRSQFASDAKHREAQSRPRRTA